MRIGLAIELGPTLLNDIILLGGILSLAFLLIIVVVFLEEEIGKRRGD